MTEVRKSWTDADRAILREHYVDWTVSIGEVAEKLGRTNASVRSMARHLGLKRPIPTGLPYDNNYI